jgi:hypothetical protein
LAMAAILEMVRRKAKMSVGCEGLVFRRRP